MSGKVSMVISMVIFGTIGIFVEFISLPSGFIASVRGIVGALVILGVMAVKHHKPDRAILKKKLWLLVLSGFAIGSNWILLFEAYRFTGIPVATVCYYTAPLFVTALAPFILKEKLGLKQFVCLIVAIVGIISVSGVFQNSTTNIKGVFLGICAAVLYASVILMNKFMNEVPAYEKTAIQLMSAGVMVLPYALTTSSEISVNVQSAALLLVVGVVHTGIAYLMYFEALKKLNGQTIAVLSYIDPASAIILSSLIFMQMPKSYELIGAVLIMGSAFISEVSFKKVNYDKNK